ncbi:MAG: aspartate aminotransferase family protein [Lachnospiraceae bacterium]|nr:aspartate aminotransferase family protein [Lachnospiraceae bacterium]
MNSQEIIAKADRYYLHTYNRFPIVLDHGEGVYLYDKDGKEYLDFGSGIAVCGLGYSNERLKNAMKAQIDKLTHTSNLFYHEPGANAAEKLCKAAGMDRVFFTNSGAEAVEGALKLAKKYANKNGKQRFHNIIAMDNSFHGRTLGSVSVTGHEEYRTPFAPMIPKVIFADYNDLESVKEIMNEETACVILETIQGEGGIYPASPDFIKGIRELCDKYDALMICDEIQCGMGRTGEMFAFQHYGIKPDIVCAAKALGCGVPVGAFLCTEKAASMVTGDHGSTYGGNPFVCAAINEVMDIYEEDRILEHVKEVGNYLWEELEELEAVSHAISYHRGIGLIQGIQFIPQVSASAVVKACMREGLILIGACNNTVRFVPPLVITKADVDKAVGILKKAIESVS